MDAGVWKVALKDPIVDVATVVGEVVTADPSYLIVIVDEAAKPVPATVTVAPTGPLVGPRVMDAVTEKIAEAELEDASFAVTVWLPKGEAGTLNVAVKEPDPSVVDVVCIVEE